MLDGITVGARGAVANHRLVVLTCEAPTTDPSPGTPTQPRPRVGTSLFCWWTVVVALSGACYGCAGSFFFPLLLSSVRNSWCHGQKQKETECQDDAIFLD
jgi:hypothetical protein